MGKICSFNTDVDGVVIDGPGMVDEYVYEIDKLASDKYYREEILSHLKGLRDHKEELEQWQRFYSKEMHEIVKEIEEYEKRKAVHFDHKNMVLEEALPEFENRIPYDIIYQVKNMYPGVADMLYKIYEAGVFEEYNAPTAINPAREIVAKQNMFKEFPWINVYGFKFFVEPFYLPGTQLKTLNRIPCDKPAKLITIKPNIDVSKSVIIDDTQYVIDSAKNLGFNAYHCGLSDNSVDVYLQAANDTIERVHNGKMKKLSR